MAKKKKGKLKKEAFKSFDSINNADSMWNRAASIKKSKSGETIQQMLGIEDDDESGIIEKQPLKMMDIVYQAWDKGVGSEEETEEEPEEDPEKEEDDDE